jgi:NADH-quinone oxidoreductase subunit J
LSAEMIFFGLVALVAVLAALGMLLSRNAVHSALFLVLNFASVAVLYVMLDAPFLAMAQVTVYTGAIMVLFLFVIMLLGVERLRRPEPRLWFQAPLALALTAMLVAALGYVMIANNQTGGAGAAVDLTHFSSPGDLSRLLFSTYLLPFEVTSLLLLVAMIGVVVLTRDELRARRSGAGRRAGEGAGER